MKDEIIIMDFETFSCIHGAYRFSRDIATDRLPGATDKYKQRIITTQLKKMNENAERRELLRKEYDELVRTGKMRPPTHMEKIISASQGHPDNEQTKAAKRLLEKYKTRNITKGEKDG